MKINWNRIPPVLRNIQFEVVGSDSDWSPYGLTITPAIEKALQESAEVMRHANISNMFPQKIRQYIEQYPHMPMFKNHLFVFYFRLGLTEEAQQVIDACVEAHPAYFYNGIMQCMLWLKSDIDRKKLPVLMSGWDIVAYAGRAKFEEHEVRTFYLNAADYYLYCDQVDLADQFVYFLEVHDQSGHDNIRITRKRVEAIKNLLRKPRGYWTKKDS